jgi:hypothetical protein
MRGGMSVKTKRVTVYFEPDVHTALRLKSAETEKSVSDIVNEAVQILLSEDAEDLDDIKARVNEPTVSFENFLTDMKARGRL